MSVIVLNAEMVSQFEQAGEFSELRDGTGRIVGFFQPVAGMQMTPPFSREEIEEHRKQPLGRPLADILKELPKR
jgi:hypothetical protein